MTYYLISEAALMREMKDFRNALIQEDKMRQGKAVVIALTAYTRALKATRRDVTVDHDPETDTYTIHNAAGMEEFLREQREKGRSVSR